MVKSEQPPIWKWIVKGYRNIQSIRTFFYKPFLKQVGTGFGIENGSVRISSPHNISIGDNFSLTHGCILMGEGEIKIGNNVLMGPYSQLYSTNYNFEGKRPIISQPSKKGKITIEDDVWIGANTIILKGITIGKGAVVGAGSVVTKNIPPFTVYAGNPAKLIKNR